MQRLWKPVFDMNGDGSFTFSDVGDWFGWWFYYPGDVVVYWIRSAKEIDKVSSNIVGFLETAPPEYGGWLAFLISLIVWVWLFLILVGCKVALEEWYAKLRAKSESMESD